jgi:hypothetical protein
MLYLKIVNITYKMTINTKDKKFVEDNPKMTKKRLIEHIKNNYSENSYLVKFYDFRNLYKKKWGVPKVWITKSKKKQIENRENQKNVLTMSVSEYEKLYDDFSNNVRKRKQDTLKYQQMLLLMVSGRRFKEIFAGEFEYNEDEDKLSYIPLKKKDKKMHEIEYIHFMSKKEFYELLMKHREDIKLYEVNYDSLNRLISRYLKEHTNINNSHKLRGLYMAYLIFSKDFIDNTNKLPMIRRYLHHDSLEASFEYQNFEITE